MKAEIRVERVGPKVERVLWDPGVEGVAAYDLTGMRITKVERVVVPGDLPLTAVTFIARLVETEVQP